jgi:hypothetical protein
MDNSAVKAELWRLGPRVSQGLNLVSGLVKLDLNIPEDYLRQRVELESILE